MIERRGNWINNQMSKKNVMNINNIASVEKRLERKTVSANSDNIVLAMDDLLGRMADFITVIERKLPNEIRDNQFTHPIKNLMVEAKNNTNLEAKKSLFNINSESKDDIQITSIFPVGSPNVEEFTEQELMMILAMYLYLADSLVHIDLTPVLRTKKLNKAYISALAYHQVFDEFIHQDRFEDFSVANEQFEKFTREARKQIVGFTETKERLEKQIEEASARFLIVEKQAKAFAAFREMDSYFANKSESHAIKHRIWLIAFALIFFIGFVELWSRWDQLGSILPVWENGKYEIGKAILFGACIGAVMWVFRIVM